MPSIRQTVAQKLYEYAKSDPSVLVLTADLSSSIGLDPIKNDLPGQFIQCGIAEQEMMSMAAGLALSGSKPFAASYAQFHPGRNWDQLRTSVCYNKAPVRLISSHYGLNVGGDGPTHQNLEYLALTLPLPNLEICYPFNNSSALWCMDRMYQQNNHSTILFQPRESQSDEIDDIPTETLDQNGFVYINNHSKNLIITAGLLASEEYTLLNEDTDFIFLVNLTHLNQPVLCDIISTYSNIIVAEEHQEFGGIGSLLSCILNANSISRIFHHVAVKKQFGKSGLSGKKLWQHYHLHAQSTKSFLI